MRVAPREFANQHIKTCKDSNCTHNDFTQVKSCKLDTWVKEHRDELNITHIDYIKMDIEGAEYATY